MNYSTFSKLWKRCNKLLAIEIALYAVIIIVIYFVVLFLI
jgi:hypothetical protein